jgi:hypothetical protein
VEKCVNILAAFILPKYVGNHSRDLIWGPFCRGSISPVGLRPAERGYRNNGAKDNKIVASHVIVEDETTGEMKYPGEEVTYPHQPPRLQEDTKTQ